MSFMSKIITTKDVKDILINLDFEHIENNKFWSIDMEEEIKVILMKNTLNELINWLTEYYYNKGEYYGVLEGKRKFISDFKKLLKLK